MTTAARSLTAATILLCAVAPASGQQYSGWHTNLDRAAEVSAKSGKPIFAVFRCER